jgi:hypothetical protein
MTALPVSYDEASARLHAREFLVRMREGPWDALQLPCAPLDPTTGHAVTRRLLRLICETTPRGMDVVVEIADRHGDRDAYDVLMEIRDERIERGEPLGAVLGAFVIRLGRRPFQPRGGRDRSSNLVADIVLTLLVLQLVERFGLKPTRSQTGRKLKPSACNIAAEEAAKLGLHRGNEQALQQIWRKYSAALLHGYRWPSRAR